MKHHFFLICSTIGIFFFSCTKKPEVIILPEIQFALNHIYKSLKDQQIDKNAYKVSFRLDSTSLDEEAYKIEVSDMLVEVIGGDRTGLMYGGLELAEQISLDGKPKETTGKPYLKKRGIKFNVPLDARTPSYDDSGDAAQKNITEMWEWDFWKSFLDQMAIHRYNTLSLWNPHPFPSMIKQPDYPDVALQDVKVTTLIPVGRENEWGDPQLVTSNVMENLKMVKKMTIDEKIAFWKKVMRYAKERGIDTYFITWNICPNSVAKPVPPYYKTFGMNMENEEPGKHGVSHQVDNPITIAYHRDAVKTFLLTYPDVKGIGVTAGEHMPKTFEQSNKEKWLWESYGKGILDAKKEQPGRKVDFIHRVWFSDMKEILKHWKAYPDNFEVSFKYAKARLYSSPHPNFAKKHIKSIEPYNLKSWWNLRNDDIFVYRWGDPEYVRSFLRYFPKDVTAGYYMGSDGYVWGKEFVSKNAELAGELEIKKHWYGFMLWGRLGYDDTLDEAFFIKKIANHFPEVDAKGLYTTWKTASKIIPLVNTFHWRNWDHQWSVEACIARPALGGFREVSDFIDNPTMQDSNMMNPLAYTKKMLAKDEIKGITPLDVVDRLDSLAQEAISGAQKIREHASAHPELKALLDDIDAMSFLGSYYAEKINAAVSLSFYQETKEKKHKSEAIKHLEKALKQWETYTNISTINYKSQMLARTGMLDWESLKDSVAAEIPRVKGM